MKCTLCNVISAASTLVVMSRATLFSCVRTLHYDDHMGVNLHKHELTKRHAYDTDPEQDFWSCLHDVITKVFKTGIGCLRIHAKP